MNSTGALPLIDSQQVQQQAPTAHITEVESMDRTEYVKALLVKLRAKLKTPVHDLAKAKAVRKFFIELRSVLSMDDPDMRIARVVYTDHLCEFVISKHDTFMQYGILVDSFFRCMLPVLRSSQFRLLQSKQLLYADGIPFTFAVLRKYHKDPNISVQGVEIIAAMVEFIASLEYFASNRGGGGGGGAGVSSSGAGDGARVIKPPSLAGSNPAVNSKQTKRGEKRERTGEEFTHQVIMHGGPSVVPALLCKYAEDGNELCVRRLCFCLHFLLGHSPPDFAVRIANQDDWGCLRALCSAVRWSSLDVALSAAAVLCGIVASSGAVADQCIYLGGLRDLATLMLNTPDFDVPDVWLTTGLAQVHGYARRMGEAMSDDDEEDIGAFSLAVEKIMDRRQTRRSVVAGPMPGAAGSGAVLGGAGRGGTDAGGGVAGHGDGDNADAILASAHALAAALQESAEVGYFPELPDEDPHDFDGSVLDRIKRGALVAEAGPDYDVDQLDPPPPKPKPKKNQKKKVFNAIVKPFVGEYNPKNAVATSEAQAQAQAALHADEALTQTNALNTIATTLFAAPPTPNPTPTSTVGAAGAGTEGWSEDAALDGVEPPPPTASGDDSAVSKLNYAERLQVMIMQVQSME